MSLETVYQYFRRYDKRSFQVVACMGNEPSEQDVVAFEQCIGFRLPAEFREFTMSPLGGLYMEVREHLWPRAKEFDVGPFWSFCFGLKVFGIAKDIPEWLDIRVQYEEFKKEGLGELVPFLQIEGDADRYCFVQSGEIVTWKHEEAEDRSPLNVGFSDLLLAEIDELEIRKNRKVGLNGAEA